MHGASSHQMQTKKTEDGTSAAEHVIWGLHMDVAQKRVSLPEANVKNHQEAQCNQDAGR